MSNVLNFLEKVTNTIWQMPPSTLVEGVKGYADKVTGAFYEEEHPFRIVAKNVATVVISPFYYGAACIGHTAEGLYKGTEPFEELYHSFFQNVKADDFVLGKFVLEHLPDFKPMVPMFIQAGKDFVLHQAFSYLSGRRFFGCNTSPYVRLIAHGIMVYNPINTRSFFNQIEEWWRPSGAVALTNKEVTHLSGIFPTIQAGLSGQLGPSQIVGNAPLSFAPISNGTLAEAAPVASAESAPAELPLVPESAGACAETVCTTEVSGPPALLGDGTNG
jgi:hypothetical protein